MPRNRCREKLEPSLAAEAEHATTRGKRERVAVDLRRAVSRQETDVGLLECHRGTGRECAGEEWTYGESLTANHEAAGADVTVGLGGSAVFGQRQRVGCTRRSRLFRVTGGRY